MTSLELVQSLLGNNRTMHEAANALDAWLDERLSDPATVARIAEAVRAEPPLEPLEDIAKAIRLSIAD